MSCGGARIIRQVPVFSLRQERAICGFRTRISSKLARPCVFKLRCLDCGRRDRADSCRNAPRRGNYPALDLRDGPYGPLPLGDNLLARVSGRIFLNRRSAPHRIIHYTHAPDSALQPKVDSASPLFSPFPRVAYFSSKLSRSGCLPPSHVPSVPPSSIANFPSLTASPSIWPQPTSSTPLTRTCSASSALAAFPSPPTPIFPTPCSSKIPPWFSMNWR